MIFPLPSNVTDDRKRNSWPSNSGVSMNSMTALCSSPTTRVGYDKAVGGPFAKEGLDQICRSASCAGHENPSPASTYSTVSGFGAKKETIGAAVCWLFAVKK